MSNVSFFPMFRGGCGGGYNNVNFFMPSYSCGGNRGGNLFNLNFGGVACGGFGGFGGYGGCNSVFGSLLGGGCGGFGFPFFGGGSISNGYSSTAFSNEGFATATPYGSSILSYGDGKSHSYNFGPFGSYASGDGGRAMNILGLYSSAESGGHTTRDFSGLATALLGGIFG